MEVMGIKTTAFNLISAVILFPLIFPLYYLAGRFILENKKHRLKRKWDIYWESLLEV